MSPVELSCENLSVTYRSSRMTVEALHEVTFTLSKNEFVCMVGPSGCGKSTLLRTIAGLIQPSGGAVVFNHHNHPTKSRCAMVFQDHGVFPWMTVLDNVAFALEMQGVRRKERQERARGFLEIIGLAEFAGAYPHELSGGMRQRVAVARAFIADSDILLMDEPFRALDAQTRLILQEELLHIWREFRKTVLYVTHDIDEAVLLGDRVLVMSARPAVIKEEVIIPLERPRDLTGRGHPEVEEIKWHIWKTLEQEARHSLLLGK
jgi:NitT/TauT family transport system ATP-binding protein